MLMSFLFYSRAAPSDAVQLPFQVLKSPPRQLVYLTPGRTGDGDSVSFVISRRYAYSLNDGTPTGLKRPVQIHGISAVTLLCVNNHFGVPVKIDHVVSHLDG